MTFNVFTYPLILCDCFLRLEMQVFDEMQRIIEKYKQQMEAMDDSSSKLLEPSAHLMR